MDASGLANARRRTDEIFHLLRPEALFDRPIPERHRFLFYLGHLEAFDWNLIGILAAGRDPAEFGSAPLDRLFAFGIDPTDGSLPCDSPADWPPPPQVASYVLRTREAVDRCLKKEDPHSTLLEAAVEHRLMHAETLSYMLRQLPLNRLIPEGAPGRGRRSRATAPRAIEGQAEIPEGWATLGQPTVEGGRFGWDNERDEHAVWVSGFTVDRRNVTCADFEVFLLEGGYRDRSLWSAEGWEWKESVGLAHPRSWLPVSGGWRFRAMFEDLPMPGSWPVQVSYAEAAAYARWRGASLPTEAQFHRAAFGSPEGTERAYPWGSTPPDERYGNFGFARWDPLPVGSCPAGDSAFGVADLMGNGWEWTSSPFAPFVGFTPLWFYPGYSADFFSTESPRAHRVLKGGGARTATRLLRRSFRNWFQPHYPYVDATFRCVSP